MLIVWSVVWGGSEVWLFSTNRPLGSLVCFVSDVGVYVLFPEGFCLAVLANILASHGCWLYGRLCGETVVCSCDWSNIHCHCQ